jgi:hypothetical protein
LTRFARLIEPGALQFSSKEGFEAISAHPVLLRDGCRTSRATANRKTDLANQRGEAAGAATQVLNQYGAT